MEIDQEIRGIMDNAYRGVKQMIEDNRGAVEELCKALEKYETIDGDEVHKIINGEVIDRPTVSELLETERQKLDAENTDSEDDDITDNDDAGLDT